MVQSSGKMPLEQFIYDLGPTVSQYKYHLFQVTVGWVALLGSDKGLRRLTLKPSPQEALDEMGTDIDRAVNEPAGFRKVQAQVERYLAGDAGALDNIVLDLSGTPPFFDAAWRACRQIPAGETRSYAWLAAAAGQPLAARAAGQAMARNRFALIIPCHRVIASNGDLGGYGGGGLKVKASLLARERASSVQRGR